MAELDPSRQVHDAALRQQRKGSSQRGVAARDLLDELVVQVTAVAVVAHSDDHLREEEVHQHSEEDVEHSRPMRHTVVRVQRLQKHAQRGAEQQHLVQRAAQRGQVAVCTTLTTTRQNSDVRPTRTLVQPRAVPCTSDPLRKKPTQPKRMMANASIQKIIIVCRNDSRHAENTLRTLRSRHTCATHDKHTRTQAQMYSRSCNEKAHAATASSEMPWPHFAPA